MRQTIFMHVVTALVVALSLLCGEVAVRYLVAYDSDGTCRFSILNKTLYLKPFRVPVHAVNDMLEKYRLLYVSTLGWVQRPGSTSERGLYHVNRDGVRAGSSCDGTPARGHGIVGT